MKVLLFVNSSYGAVGLWPRRNYLDFYNSLGELCTLYHYGPGEHKIWGEETVPLIYESKLTMDDVLETLKPDICLVWSYTAARKWVPGRTKSTNNTPFMALTGDYFAVPKKHIDWYDQWDLLLHKGSCHVNVDNRPFVWVPHSVNEKEFFTKPNSNYLDGRKNKIVFLGNVSRFPNYKTRKEAIRKLEPTGLLDNIGLISRKGSTTSSEDVKSEEEVRAIAEPYPAKLKEYRGALTCSGDILHSTLAKHFEIMASGTAMLTQSIKYSEILFGHKQCFFTYKDDMTDIEEVAREILNDKDKVKEVTKNALKVINKHHLHKHRKLELLDIFRALIEGKEIPRRWGY